MTDPFTDGSGDSADDHGISASLSYVVGESDGTAQEYAGRKECPIYDRYIDIDSECHASYQLLLRYLPQYTEDPIISSS